ncbi:MAG: hypothetical protein FWH21_00390 [Kiritimatiellaeota bacterium]|nr:hypothetical protein [Kiritimatiellota bacterium]
MATNPPDMIPDRRDVTLFVDRLTLARASALAQAGDLIAARGVLMEDKTFLGSSPQACDLMARIWFRLGDLPTAGMWWGEADYLARGAEPYYSTRLVFEDYARWRKHRHHALSSVWARRKARRLLRKPLAHGARAWSTVTRAATRILPLLKRCVAKLTRTPQKTK